MSRRRRSQALPPEDVLVFSRYEPQQSQAHYVPPATRPARSRAPQRRKESFVEANARFALRPDAAALFRWEDVECVFVELERSEEPECPICLHTLMAPKITPCGHVFNHVCLLQHVAHADEDGGAKLDDARVPVKCPLCSTYFALGELKDVMFRHVAALRVGGTCAMRLVGTTATDIVQPYSDDAAYTTPTEVEKIDQLFARFCVASKHLLCDMLAKTASELRTLLAEDPSLKRFVDVASKQVKASKQAVHRARKDKERNAAVAVASPAALEESKGDERLFFQAADARHIYLHPINYRCLAHEYGDMRAAPSTLQGTVLEVERLTMDEAIRRRYRFLRHLPDGCEFAMIELDLAAVLSERTKDAFARELHQRRAARARKRAADRVEDECAGKQRDQALQAYFRMNGPQPRPIAPANDEAAFPTLAGSSPSSAGTSPAAAAAAGTSPVAVAGAVPDAAAHWGPSVSSWSSVTANMGVFPALGDGGGADSGMVIGASASSPPRGAWAASPPEQLPPRGGGGGSGGSGRRAGGRTRYTTLMTNAGTAPRRK